MILDRLGRELQGLDEHCSVLPLFGNLGLKAGNLFGILDFGFIGLGEQIGVTKHVKITPQDIRSHGESLGQHLSLLHMVGNWLQKASNFSSTNWQLLQKAGNFSGTWRFVSIGLRNGLVHPNDLTPQPFMLYC